MAPLSATVFDKEHLRCALCGEVLTAPSPAGIGETKYDETATAMTAQLKYGTGLPFNRIEKLHAGMGIPLPASTQWEIVRDGAVRLAPTHEQLLREAAQGAVLYNDDTTAKILAITQQRHLAAAADDAPTDARTGIFTSGIVATGDGHRIAIFCTGVRHAGENLADVLQRRQAELPSPIQMCDGLASNTSGDFTAILANCIVHARRKYVEVADSFPQECAHVLKLLGEVYGHDAEAREQRLSPAQRLALHQDKSRPLMDELEQWMQQQIDQRKVEPNSGLGKAISYMQRRWQELTLFLRQPGAPLDNNLCERALKKAILHRKNALFFKTTNGARVADLYMSLIHTCELNQTNPFDYLTTLLRHHHEVARAPADWMPWNYQAALANLTTGPDPPH
jgi:transposase